MVDKKDKPLILVTNDDGIDSKGINELAIIASNFGNVYVVAPDKPQSGMSSAITLESIIRCNLHENVNSNIVKYSCTGTPVDCVKLAINKILPRKPDLVLSGINHGSNSSINVIYSGTMAAAFEGCLEKIPSIGFSLLDYSSNADFNHCTEIVHSIVEKILNNGLENGVCLNVNIPKKSNENIKGIKICRQADANWIEEFDERVDPKKLNYFWLTGTFVNYDSGNDTDEQALKENYISIVPVKYDLTDHNYISSLKKIF